VSRDRSALRSEPLDEHAPGVIASFATDDGSEPWYVLSEERALYRLRVKGVGEFHISPSLDDVTWIGLSDESDRLAPVLVCGTLLAVIFTLEGRLVLHGSAVSAHDGALAFVGPSGRGKSTTAALCAVAGGRVISDDVLLVEMRGPEVWCRGSGGELRLREKARTLASMFEDATVGETPDRRMSLVPRDGQTAWTRLDAVAFPIPDPGSDALSTERLSRSDALFGLLGSPRVEGLRTPHLASQQFGLVAELVKRVPVFQVRVPWGPPWRPEVGAELLRFHAAVPDRA
jgi:hypothetical protein